MSVLIDSVQRRHELAVAERFQRETAQHEMAVQHDEGLYRHVRFQKPGTGFYWFDLVTWPGNLTINGDMGTFTFARLTDMIPFFAGDRINPTYWAEKVRGSRSGIDGTEGYSEELAREIMSEHIAEYEVEYPGLAAAVAETILAEDLSHEEYVRTLLNQFEYKGFSFIDSWEWSFKDFNTHFLWCCHAVQWGANRYLATKGADQ